MEQMDFTTLIVNFVTCFCPLQTAMAPFLSLPIIRSMCSKWRALMNHWSTLNAREILVNWSPAFSKKPREMGKYQISTTTLLLVTKTNGSSPSTLIPLSTRGCSKQKSIGILKTCSTIASVLGAQDRIVAPNQHDVCYLYYYHTTEGPWRQK